MKRGLQKTWGSSYNFGLWPHKKMLKIILSENFEKLLGENRLRYSNEIFTETFIEKYVLREKSLLKIFEEYRN